MIVEIIQQRKLLQPGISSDAAISVDTRDWISSPSNWRPTVRGPLILRVENCILSYTHARAYMLVIVRIIFVLAT